MRNFSEFLLFWFYSLKWVTSKVEFKENSVCFIGKRDIDRTIGGRELLAGLYTLIWNNSMMQIKYDFTGKKERVFVRSMDIIV